MLQPYSLTNFNSPEGNNLEFLPYEKLKKSPDLTYNEVSKL
jgi:hypothetical protein